MTDDSERVKASQSTVCTRMSNAREDVAKMLAVIYSETATAGCSTKGKSSDTELKKVAFPGRYVTKVLRVRPFEVTKRFVRPQLSCENKSLLDAHTILTKLFHIKDLKGVLLVITPTVGLSDNHIIHAYVIEGERHMGVTSLTPDEMNIIVHTQKTDSYFVVHCSCYIELDDAFKKSRIRNQIFDVLHNQFPKPIRSWYDGKRITLRFRRSMTCKKLNLNYKYNSRRCKPKTSVEASTDMPVPSPGDNSIQDKTKKATGTMHLPTAETVSNMKSQNAIRPRTALRCATDRNKHRSTNGTRYSPMVTKSKFNAKPTAVRCNLPTVARCYPKPSGTSKINPYSQMTNARCILMSKTLIKSQMGTHETVDSCASKAGLRANSPVTKNLSIGGRSFGSRDNKSSISVEKSGKDKSSSTALSPIRNQALSILKSRSILPTSCTHNSIENTQPRKHIDIGDKDSTCTVNSLQLKSAAVSCSSTKRAPITKQAHAIIRNRIDSPVANYSYSFSHASPGKPAIKANGIKPKLSTKGSNIPIQGKCSAVIKNKTISAQRSQSVFPIPNEYSESDKSPIKIRSQSDMNVRNTLSVTNDDFTPVPGSLQEKRASSLLLRGSEDSRPTNWTTAHSVRSNSVISNSGNQSDLPASSSRINNLPRPVSRNHSGFLRKVVAAANRNSTASLKSNSSVYKTPMGTRSHSPATSSSSSSLLGSQSRTQVSIHRSHHRRRAISNSKLTPKISSQAFDKKNFVWHRVPLSFDTCLQNPINDSWYISDHSSHRKVGDGKAKKAIHKRQSTVSGASSYVSFPSSSPRKLKAAHQAEQGMPQSSKNHNKIAFNQRYVNSERPMSPASPASPSQPSNINYLANAASKRKAFVGQVDKAMLLQRERLWTSSGPNSKRRVSFQSDVPKKTKVVKKVQQKAVPQKVQYKEPPKNIRMKNYAHQENPPAVKSDGIKVLWKPRPLSESVGTIYLPTKVSKLKFEDSQTILRASSSYFDKLMDPLRVPANFSKRATEKLQSKLNRMTAKQAFENLGKLVERINARAIPQNKQLITFFRIAELLDIKLFVRAECHWPDTSPTIDPRCRVDSYMFDDRKDFIVSLGMLHKQLMQFSNMFPGIKPNIRFVDNALELTMLPSLLTRCIKSVMVSLRARGLFDLLAEITYELVHPQPGVLTIPRQAEKLKPRCERFEESEAMKKVLELEEAVRQLKMKQLSQQTRYT